MCLQTLDCRYAKFYPFPSGSFRVIHEQTERQTDKNSTESFFYIRYINPPNFLFFFISFMYRIDIFILLLYRVEKAALHLRKQHIG